MPPRCIPGQPDFKDHSERVVWESLCAQLPIEAVIFHGLRLSDRRQDREADLVVAMPGTGIAVLEVKGGQVGLDGGQWTQTGGGTVKHIHPVDQARTCKYLLRTYLSENPGWHHGWPRLAHLVVFPFTRIPADFAAPDCPRWMVVGSEELANVADRICDALEWAEGQPDPPTVRQVGDLVECLAGRKLGQRDLIAAAAEREAATDLLTARQGQVLDHIRLLTRVEIRGGAGSGKTWLALEQARRLAQSGKRVGLVCYSRGLAAYLQRRATLLPDPERPAYVGTFHGLGLDWLGVESRGEDDSAFWEEQLPASIAELAAQRPGEERFDAFVVDEAQDFAATWWPAMLSALREPAVGGLYVFADEGQRVFARAGRPPVDLVPIPLDENLRNTKQIAQAFGSLAPEQMRYLGGDGPPVRFIPCSTGEAIGVASDQAAALLDEGWAPEQVALLTTGSRHPLQAEQQAHGQDAYWSTYWESDDLFYGHVLGFKGLERPAVVLCVNGFRELGLAREMLYVGLSRARDVLVVCGDPELIRQVGGGGVAERMRRATVADLSG